MGRRAAGSAGPLSKKITEAIDSLRRERGLDHAQLFSASDMSATYYYRRLRGEASWELNDLERIAAALSVHWFQLARMAAGDPQLAQTEVEPVTDGNVGELARRVRFLISSLRANGEEYSWSQLDEFARSESVPFTEEHLEEIVTGRDTRVTVRSLELLTGFWDVPEAFLTDFDDLEAYEMATAIAEFRQVLRESGALSVSTRAIGELSASALRAITRSLRSIN